MGLVVSGGREDGISGEWGERREDGISGEWGGEDGISGEWGDDGISGEWGIRCASKPRSKIEIIGV